MALESHAALAGIRDSLLETYASNDAMNQLILSELDPRAWRAQPPGGKGGGRPNAALLAHLHNCPPGWLKKFPPPPQCPAPPPPHPRTHQQAAPPPQKNAPQAPPT